jgi:hypothetical protein
MNSFVCALHDRNTEGLEVNTYLHFRMSLVEIISKYYICSSNVLIKLLTTPASWGHENGESKIPTILIP